MEGETYTCVYHLFNRERLLGIQEGHSSQLQIPHTDDSFEIKQWIIFSRMSLDHKLLFQLKNQPFGQSGQPCGENKNNPEQELSEYLRARAHFLQSTDSREREGKETEVWPIKYLCMCL